MQHACRSSYGRGALLQALIELCDLFITFLLLVSLVLISAPLPPPRDSSLPLLFLSYCTILSRSGLDPVVHLAGFQLIMSLTVFPVHPNKQDS